MVSYGFDSIEEFYVSSSTKDVVGNVKIPLLFIQVRYLINHSLLPLESSMTTLHMHVYVSFYHIDAAQVHKTFG